jgi:hyaluronoglucosaminidase
VTRTGLAALLAATALLFVHPAAGAGAVGVPSLYPRPQSTTVGPGKIAVPPTVRVVTTRSSDPGAVATVRDALENAGLIITAAPSARLWVVVGRSPALERALGTKTSAGLPSGGYVLVARKGRIVLDGTDRVGQFYAAQTFAQLLDHRRFVPEIVVRDWPTLEWRGVVEGFYGKPWSQPERLSMLEFMGAHKLNMFMYGPKDDGLLRSGWDIPFPKGYLSKLQTLVLRSARNHVEFNLVLSPGLTICYTSPDDQAKALGKLESAYDAGVRSFTIALDDIDLSRPRCAADARYGLNEVAAAVTQSKLVNVIENRFVRTHRGVRPLIAVPTQYSGIGATPYTDAFANHVDPRVIVQWTGRYGISVVFNEPDYHAAQFIYRHPLMVWDNYFVTDYARQALALGPLDKHDHSIGAYVHGLVADPMELPQASRLPLFTVADFAWNPTGYDATRSWNAGLREFVGGDAVALPALRLFADANWGAALNPIQAPALTAAIKDFWARWSRGDVTSVASLTRWFQSLQDAPATLAATLPNPQFLAEVQPWLAATSVWAAAARTALEALVAARTGNTALASAKLAQLPALVQTARGFTVGIVNVSVAGAQLEKFVRDVQAGASG